MAHQVIALVPIVVVSNRDCRDATGLDPVELRTVVALLAARRVGRLGATCTEIRNLTGMAHSNMRTLERRRWVMAIGKIGMHTVWAPGPTAAARLELGGWQVRLFTDEELPRVDANLPGFLEPLQTGPGVIDTTGESVEDERATA
jgi:hypothetical protein